MAFGDSLKAAQAQQAQTPRQSPYLNVSPGERIIRILGSEKSFWRYWIRVNVNGKMEGRPIIAEYENPIRDCETLDEASRKPTRRFVVNVLDRTPVLRVKGTGEIIYPDENGAYNAVGKAVEGKPEPLNEVRLLEFGRSLMDEIMAYDGRMRSRVDYSRVLRVTDVDLALIITGQGKNRTIKVMQSFDESPVSVDEVFDLDEVIAPYPNEAIQALLDGENYLDVLSRFNLLRAYRKVPYNP